MSLRFGRHYNAIPGPSAMPDRVLAAMQRPAPDIYSAATTELVHGLVADLRRVARTAGRATIYIANGHGAWEAANCNLFSRGDRALVAVTGLFGLGWAASVERLGVRADRIDFGRKSAADPQRIADALKADRAHEIRAVLVTQVDTATSVKSDIAAIRAAIDAAGHPALLVVDAIASLGCDRMEMDAWGVDVLVAASQKGLMVPPGLAFVWMSEKAMEACAASDLRTPYWDWTMRAAPEETWQYFFGTAPTHHLFALREALTMLLEEEGLENAWARHRQLARSVWAAFDAWGQGGDITLNVADEGARGHSVTAARIGGGGAARLRAWTEAEAGVTLGIGIGMAERDDPAAGDFLRVAHMGHVSAHMTLGVIAAMEAGMRALGIPHGAGAVEAAAAAIAAR